MKLRKIASGPLILALIATLCLIVVLTPMRSVLTWATILSVIFFSLNEKLSDYFGSRNKGTAATLAVILLTAVVPFLIALVLVISQALELADNADQIASSANALIVKWAGYLPGDIAQTIEKRIESLDINTDEMSGLVISAVSFSLSLGGDFLILLGTMIAVLYVAFFLLRDWQNIVSFLSAMVPLEPTQKQTLAQRLADTTLATVRGVILVAALQSFVAGVVYWMLGLEAYAVLAVITFAGCLIPAVGSGLVWVPVAIYFLITGDITKGIAMVFCGLVVIGMVDNFLRPRLIAERSALPDFLIFLSSFGGLAIAGLDGLFLGPIVAAFFVESWNVYFATTEEGPIDSRQSPPQQESSEPDQGIP